MILIVMGVAGSGKTTVGALYAQRHECVFMDADDYHSPDNIAKMRQGTPLQDEDRWPWLDRMNQLLKQAAQKGESVVLACSALKQRYRDRLALDLVDVRWVYLKGDFDVIRTRLEARKGHYMKAGLLESQFAALEAPIDAIELDVAPSPQDIVILLEHALRSIQHNFSPGT